MLPRDSAEGKPQGINEIEVFENFLISQILIDYFKYFHFHLLVYSFGWLSMYICNNFIFLCGLFILTKFFSFSSQK